MKEGIDGNVLTPSAARDRIASEGASMQKLVKDLGIGEN